MQLTLTVLRCPDAVAPETRTISGGEYSVGRGPGVDWVLPDPERLLSKRHFALAYRGGSWQIADTSTNGTFLNRDTAAVGQGEVRNLRDGDRLRMGAYEIEIRLVEEAGGRMGTGAGPTDARQGSSAFGDPFGMDPFAPPRPERNPFDEPDYQNSGMSPTAAQLPHDFDPLAPEPNEMPFRGPTQADNSPVMEDAFRPPASIGQAPLHAGGVIPGDDLLPDDWDKDLLEGISPPGAKAAPAPAPVAPVRHVPAEPVAPPPQPFVAPEPVEVRVPHPQPIAPAPESPFDVEASFEENTPFDEPPAAPVPVARPAPPPPPPPQRAPAARAPAPAPTPAPASDDALLAAFLRGVGLRDVRPNDPVAAMEALGEAFRALVTGLRSVLIARAAIKSEFRIEQTMIRARGNNPLKFSADDDDALTALLGAGRRTDMAPQDAVADALRDIRMHELASMAAMQTAVRAMLDGLDPAKLRAAADQGGGMTVLPAQKKARAWDAFEQLYARTVQALTDDFDSAFGKAFARAYERALEDVSAKERE